MLSASRNNPKNVKEYNNISAGKYFRIKTK